MVTLNEISFNNSSSIADIVTTLGFSWDSTNAIAYKGSSAINGFKVTLSSNQISFVAYRDSTTYGNAATFYSPVKYIKNTDNTACLFGGIVNNAVYLDCFWAEAESPLDNDTHYMFAQWTNTNQNTGCFLWTDKGYYNGAIAYMFNNYFMISPTMVSAIPITVDSLIGCGEYSGVTISYPMFTDKVMITIVGKSTLDYQIVTIDGYNYVIANQTGSGSAKCRPIICVGQSS